MTAPIDPEVIVVGSYLVALVMDVDRLPTRGETLMGRNFRTAYGGKGSDMAVQAARLGAKVRFAGVVGDDDFGSAFLGLMAVEGVDTALVDRVGGLATGAGFIIKSRDGHNVITIDPGASALMDPARSARAVAVAPHGSVVLTQLEIPLDAALAAATEGHRAGLRVILNPAPAQDLRGHDLSAVDFLTPNETEARVCLGLDPNDLTADAEIARRLLGLGCHAVVMTLGDRGALIATSERVTVVPAYAIADVVDSNGAGDSFNAAFATRLVEGATPEDSARFANAVAGLCCTRWDTVPSYHTRSDVAQFLATLTV